LPAGRDPAVVGPGDRFQALTLSVTNNPRMVAENQNGFNPSS